MANYEIELEIEQAGSAEIVQDVEMGDAAHESNAEAWAVGKRHGIDVPSTDITYHNNSKYYAGQASGSASDASDSASAASGSASAADDSAEDAEAWAVGQRDGTDVASTDPTYHNNSKYYSEQASGSASAASGSASAADDSAEDAESWAVGQRDGTDVGNDDPAYHNNSKYYSEQASGSASAASGSASAADGSAEDAEAWAVGQRNGTDVPSTDPAYHNNAKYYQENTESAIREATQAVIGEILESVEASAETAEAYAVGQRNGTDVPSTDPSYHNNSKYYSEQASGSASAASGSASAADDSAEDAEAWAVGQRNGTDVTSGDPAYHNNSKYYSEQASGSASAASGSASAADDSAEDAEAWAVGKRDGTDVGDSDPAYHNNSKYYAGQASGSASDASDSASAASGSASAADDSAEDAEAWAVGKRDGTDVASDDPAYHNNSKYYSEQASGSASAASGSASAADDSAEDAEAYAVGQRNGTDVPSTDPSYHNNSKYYSEQASGSASAASGSASAADDSAEDAEAYAVGKRDGTDVASGDPAYHNNSKYYSEQASDSASAASGSASAADDSAEDAEAWSVGKRNGTDVGSSDPAYHNNAKYWADQAAQSASQGNADALYAALAKIGIGVVDQQFVIQPVTAQEEEEEEET